MVAGRTVNGATRWISLGPVSLQPSEIAKVTGLIWASAYLSKRWMPIKACLFWGTCFFPWPLFLFRL